MADIEKSQTDKPQFADKAERAAPISDSFPLAEWGDVLTIRNGKNQKAVECPVGDYPICGSGGEMGRASAYITRGNSVIIGRKGNINNPILMREPFWNVDTAFGLEPNEGRLTVEYLFYYCEWFNFEKLNKAVTIPSLTKADLLKLNMPLPPLAVQRGFTDRIGLLDRLKSILTEIEGKLDDLVKSRFVEMFGSERFDLVKLGDYCERITKGATPTTLGYRYMDNGINFIKVESLAEDGSIIADKVAHISDECNAAMRRSQLRMGDIVFSIAGAIGRTAIIPDSILPANTNQALAIIRLRDPLAFDRTFLRYVFVSSDVTRSISSSKRGIAQVNLSLTDIKKLRVPLPPLALQQEFTAFVSQVDKLRFAAQQQIDKLETLKKSLMQEYFG